MNKGSTYSESEVNIVRALRRRGLSTREISTHMLDTMKISISQSTVTLMTKDLQNPRDAVREMVIAAVASGATRTAAAMEFGLSRESANAWCRHLPAANRKGCIR